MLRRTSTIATAKTERGTRMIGNSESQEYAQRQWNGHVSDATVRKWLEAKGLPHATVSVFKNVDWRTFKDSQRDVFRSP